MPAGRCISSYRLAVGHRSSEELEEGGYRLQQQTMPQAGDSGGELASMTSVGPLSSQSEGGLLPAMPRSSTKSRRAIDERLDAKITNAKLRISIGGEGNTQKRGLDKRRSVTIATLRRENSRRRSRNISLVALEQNLMESDEDEVDIESADTGDEAEDLIQYLRAKIRKTTVLGERRRSLGITIQAFGEESEESTKQSKRVVNGRSIAKQGRSEPRLRVALTSTGRDLLSEGRFEDGGIQFPRI